MIFNITEIEFKHILFISTWVWDNLIEWALDPPPPPPPCNRFHFVSLMQLFGQSLRPRKIRSWFSSAHSLFLQHVSQLNHVTHMLKSRFITFMVANRVGKNKHVAYVANLCFRNTMSSSGRNINKIMSEYKFDYRLLQLPQDFNIKANMDIMYKDTISAQIHGEDWKINMILEIVDCLNMTLHMMKTCIYYPIFVSHDISISNILYYFISSTTLS